MNLRMSIPAAVLLVALAACGTGDGGTTPDGASTATAPRAASAAAPSPGAEAPTVTIQRFTFMPERIEVRPGTTITFVNTDEVLHTVTAGTPDDVRAGGFDGQLDGVGAGDAEFALTLDEPGTYPYVCTRHLGVPGMSGTIVVRE